MSETHAVAQAARTVPESMPFDFVHTGPSTLAGKYLRLFWQPVYRAEDLTAGNAVPIQVMSERFTLYRGESGTPHLVAFRCAHRGTQLSAGWVEEDCIRCRYHGWKYDGSGQCVEQPEEPVSFAQKVKIKSYPTVEYLGLIFAYLGEGEPPPFRRFPPFEKEGVLRTCPTEAWPCNFLNRCENTVDIAHLNWAHRGTRDRLNLKHMPHATPTSAEETEYGIKHVITYGDGRVGQIEFHMPNISHVRPLSRIAGSNGSASATVPDRLFCYVPIDDESSSTFVIDFVPLTGEAAQEYKKNVLHDHAQMQVSPNEIGAAILAGKTTFKDLGTEMSSYYSFWIEDYVTLVGQGAIPERHNDRLGRTDVGPILVRKLWQRELRALAGNEPIKQWT